MTVEQLKLLFWHVGFIFRIPVLIAGGTILVLFALMDQRTYVPLLPVLWNWTFKYECEYD